MVLCSIAIASGVFGALALIRGVALRRCGAYDGRMRSMRHGCGRRGFGRGPGGSFWLRRIFHRLDTTPGQEREIRAAIEDFQAAAWAAKDHVVALREDLARAVAGDAFDAVAVAEAGTRIDDATGRTKEAFAAALEKIHAVLDPHQRERLAELLRRKSPFGPFGGGPYRGGGPAAAT